MKSVLISINRPYTDLISSGRKQWEIRKNKPKILVPFKCYIYETLNNRGCGFVVGEFICDRIEKIYNCGGAFYIKTDGKWDIAKTNLIGRESCLDYDDMKAYLKNKDGYAWHISDLKIYDVPKEIREFKIKRKCTSCDENCIVSLPLTRPFQSWGYVEE